MMSTWKNKKVLVTGGDGFIGFHLLSRLKTLGAQVFALCRTNRYKRLDALLDSVAVVQADLRNPDHLTTIVAEINPEIVFHLAASIDVTRSWDAVIPVVENNVLGTVHMLLACRNCDTELFVNFGSSEEYGTVNEHVPLNERRREAPVSPYSFSKTAATHFCQMAYRVFGKKTINLRLFPTYGPAQSGDMLIPSAIMHLLRDGLFSVSEGSQKREFNYVDDVVEAIVLTAACEKVGNGDIVNIGSGCSVTVKEVISLIKKIIGGNTRIEFGAVPLRKEEGRFVQCDNGLLKNLTGWYPQVSLEQGLEKTVAWYKKHYANE